MDIYTSEGGGYWFSINRIFKQEKIMKDLKKIQEFFSKPLKEATFKVGDKVTYLGHPAEITKVNKEMTGAITYNVSYDKGTGKTKASNIYNKGGEIKPLKEGKEEYFKPSIRKDKSNPNFLYVDIAYPAGSGVLSIGGNKTMSGQDREAGAAKALVMGNAIAKKLEAKYNIEDIEVKDLKNGKVQVFAVSDDFTKMASPSLDEAKKETGIDMVKKRLDALGVKYEMSKTDKVRPFKAIYQPINKSDEFYDEFEDIIDLFNLKGVVKTSMDEAKFMSGMLSGKDFINAKLSKYPKAVTKVNQLINMIGEDKFTVEMAEWIFDFFNNASYESPVNEAKKEDAVDTITMDVPLFIRMLEYSREDAAEDMDLHDVTEKAISLGKERGILQMNDYDEIIGTTEKVNEVNLKQAKLSSAEYQKAKKLKDFKASDWKWNADEDLYTKVNEGIERKIFEALDKINEELCPAGKAYRKRRIAAGEKSSAYLSGRAVKVCKGQMSGKKKKK
jgi:hypothetical protein